MKGLNIQEYNSSYDNLALRVLERSGIKEFDAFLSQPNRKFFKTDDHIKDIDKGIDMLNNAIITNQKIGLLVDPDVDGFSSASLFKQFVNKIAKHIEFEVFYHSQHGIKNKKLIEEIVSSDIELMVLPDSSSNDHDEQKILLENGISVLIIDHHIIEDESDISDSVALINNQRKDQNINKNLTGVGMVLKFIYYFYKRKGWSERFFSENEFFNLAAIGQVGDVSDISDPEIRYIVTKGLALIENKLIDYSINDKFGVLAYRKDFNIAPVDLSFSINPQINAVARVGTKEERELVFEALSDSTKEYQKFEVVRKRKQRDGKMRDTILHWNIYDLAIDYMNRVRNRQNRIVNSIRDEAIENISSEGGVVISLIEDLDKKNGAVIGLTANKIANKFGKPTLLLRKSEEKGTWNGSGRGYKDSLDSFKNWCSQTGLTNYAKGHDNAFGVEISDENLADLIIETTKVKTQKKDRYLVDRLYDWAKAPSKRDIKEMFNTRWVVGGKVDEIKVGVKNIKLSEVKLFIYNGVIKFVDTVNSVEYITFSNLENIKNELEKGANMIDIVGKPSINTWMGNTQKQVLIDEIAIY